METKTSKSILVTRGESPRLKTSRFMAATDSSWASRRLHPILCSFLGRSTQDGLRPIDTRRRSHDESGRQLYPNHHVTVRTFLRGVIRIE